MQMIALRKDLTFSSFALQVVWFLPFNAERLNSVHVAQQAASPPGITARLCNSSSGEISVGDHGTIAPSKCATVSMKNDGNAAVGLSIETVTTPKRVAQWSAKPSNGSFTLFIVDRKNDCPHKAAHRFCAVLQNQ
jgi:hypothetical protein